tara:strand:+ start:505 stop:3423 length:2919 start_codon:yes stop_codon:yes gene_type:complete
MTKIYSPKKLIEVALPLDDINVACAHEKMPGIGPHPRGIHLWWARRPLAAARAVIFAQMVNDPGYQQDAGFKYGVNKKAAEIKREKLFQIIRDLVKWENTNNEEVLNRAREAIKESWRETCHLNRNHPQAAELFNPEILPAFHDPFAGGGAIPLEAQRLGLESYASDLNPVAVMINKAMIEIPPKFSGQAPVGPIPKGEKQQILMEDWSGAKGLAEDVRRYGHWMREEAFKRIGHLYPKVKITDKMILDRPDLKAYTGEDLTVIAWLWARTVKSPNPAYMNLDCPLIKSYVLSNKKGRNVYLDPVVEGDVYTFDIKTGEPPKNYINGTKSKGKGASFSCIYSGATITGDYIKEQGTKKKIGQKLIALVVAGRNERIYLSANDELEADLLCEKPNWRPTGDIPARLTGGTCVPYGYTEWGDIFTDRQLIGLSTFVDLLDEVKEKALLDLSKSEKSRGGDSLSNGGCGANAYSDALAVYLAFCVDRCADFNNSLTGWRSGNEKIMYLFARQSIPMVWDFGEANLLENVVGSFITNLEYQVKCIQKLPLKTVRSFASQQDAARQNTSNLKVISTDPPYYDNIAYADLSDFFYVWMRKSLKDIFPSLFATMVVPKMDELVATAYRHGGKEKAEKFFLSGMTSAMKNMAESSHPAFPVTIYYAFKQSETKADNTTNTGWETFLDAVITAGFSIDGTWPVRSEQSARMIGMGANALASSVVLVCRKREVEAETISRRDFQRELREQMPEALEAMIGGETGTTPIAPVDLAQAAIGPGMAIYSKYAAVLNQDGSKMSVHDALILINRAITDYLNPDSGNFDADTLFCDDWFSQYGWSEGQFGPADTLARAKGTSVEGVRDAGVIEARGGKVRLLKWSEYPNDWDPKTDTRTPVWEACHQLIRALNQLGENQAGALLARMPERGEPIRQLAYHLYSLCERKKWAEDARAYNELIGSWHAIVAASHDAGHKGSQAELGLDF